jgi:hypothetical protein
MKFKIVNSPPGEFTFRGTRGIPENTGEHRGIQGKWREEERVWVHSAVILCV